MNTNAIIIKATSKHCEEVVKIAVEGNLFGYPKIFYAFLVMFGWLYLVVIDKKILGYICYITLPFINRAFIIQVGIKKKQQGQGLGTRLLSFACRKGAYFKTTRCKASSETKLENYC